MEDAATMEIINREQRIDEFVNDTRDEGEIIDCWLSKDLSITISLFSPTVIRMMEDAAKEADVGAHRQAVDWHLQEIARLVAAGNQQQAIEHCLLAVGWHQEQIQRLLL